MVAHKSFENQTQSSPTVRMRKGRCKLQWIATNIFILFGLIFIIIELELIKKEINTIKKQTQKGTGFFRIQPLRLSPLLFVTNIRHRYRCRSLLEFMLIITRFILFHGILSPNFGPYCRFLPWVKSIWNLYVCMRV